MKVGIINFSGRTGGNCHDIAMVIQSNRIAESITVQEMSSLRITPCIRCNYECFMKGAVCPYAEDDVNKIYDLVCNCDLVYYVVPNYCDYPCSEFFIFNERGQGYFHRKEGLQKKYIETAKKFIMVSNTNQDNFKQVFSYHVEEGNTPDILYLSAKVFHKSSIKGDLMEAAEAKNTLMNFI